jgi:hypothetical protein
MIPGHNGFDNPHKEGRMAHRGFVIVSGGGSSILCLINRQGGDLRQYCDFVVHLKFKSQKTETKKVKITKQTK